MSKSKLFKNRITKTDYNALIKELSDANDGDTSSLMKLLFCTEKPKEYPGKYKHKQHEKCKGLENEVSKEKRLCKCMYYLNSNYPKNCDRCSYQDRFKIIGDYRITDYEFPAYYSGKGIGNIDLIISKDDIHYATEVKPYKGNGETLLRMIAEIMTYTEGYPVTKYKKAIAFFEKDRGDKGEKTKQQKEYETADPALLELLKTADITVFRFEEAGEKAYRICKL